jgi:hypothetical protein
LAPRSRRQGARPLKERSGATIPGGNQELFLLAKDTAGAWKITHCIFNVIVQP